jgi:hypothetical protein
VTSRRLAGMLLVSFLVVACHQDPPTPDLLVYAVNEDNVPVTVRADGSARTVPPCGTYSQGFFGTGDHDLQLDTRSGARGTPLHSVLGSHATAWYLIKGGVIVDSTQADLNVALAACKAVGTSPSP